MTQYAKQMLYIGAGTHIDPVKHFPKTKTFIFIDTQPRSEFDCCYPKFYKKFYKPYFLYELETICDANGFMLEEFLCLDKNYYKKIISWKWYYSSWFFKIPDYINPILLVFRNNKTQQTLKYYISTNINFNINEKLINDIKTSDGIIVCGYLPHADILNYFDSPKMFFGYTNTNYEINEVEFIEKYDNNIIYFLQKCLCNREYYFSNFYLVIYETGEIIKCKSFENFCDSKRILTIFSL